MANFLSNLKSVFNKVTQDDEGWFRKGKFTPGSYPKGPAPSYKQQVAYNKENRRFFNDGHTPKMWVNELVADTKKRGLKEGLQDLFNPILMNPNIEPVAEPLVGNARVGIKNLRDFANSFNPTSNAGNNFWSSPVAQGMAKVQQAPKTAITNYSNNVKQRWEQGGGAKQLNPIWDTTNKIRNNPAMAKLQQTIQNPNLASNVGNWLRTNADTQANTFDQNNLKPLGAYHRTIGNMGANLAQSFVGGVQRGGLGLSKAIKPGQTLGERIQGGVQTGMGLATAVAPTTGVFGGANLVSSMPRKQGYTDPDLFRRFAAGTISGQTGQKLATNVPDKKTNLGPFGEADLVKGAGSMYGFTQNPAWKAIFGKTSPISEAKWLANPVTNFLVTRGVKGGIEGLIQGLGDMPDNLSKQDKAKFMANNVLTGIGSEIIFDAAQQGISKGAKRLWNGAEQTKVYSQAYDMLRDVKGRFTEMASTIKYPGISAKDADFLKAFDAKGGKGFYPTDMERAFKLREAVRQARLKQQSGKIDLNAKIGGKEELPQTKGIKITTEGKTTQLPQQTELQTKTSGVLQSDQQLPKPIQISQPSQTQGIKIKQSSDQIITEAKKQIGSLSDKPNKPIKQVADEIYTQWVDRYQPIIKASSKAKEALKQQGAELRPEYDPGVLVRKLTGAGGIADQRFSTELKPIIDEMDNLKIDKGDMDVYLKARRDIGLAERGIKGSDATKASQIIGAIESKYNGVKDIAQKFYDYQNRGFQEMIDAGFLSKESAELIRQKNPDYVPFNRVMDEMDNYLGLPTRKAMQGTQPVKKIKGSDRQIYSPVEEVIANTFKQRAAIEKNNVAKAVAGLQDITDMGFEKVAKSGNDTITIWNNGNKEYWKVGTDIASTAKGLNEENMNTLLKIFTVPANILRQGATGRNPEFMIPNVIRDQLDAGITSKYGYIPFVDYLSGLKSMLTNDEAYKKWASSGANIDLGEMSGRKSIKQSFDAKTAKKGLFSWLNKGLDVMGKYSEQPTRVGLFKKAYEKTGNELLAMMDSRDATVDFARMGSKMKVANSIIPFLNVQIQGFDKLIRAAKDHPGKVALNGAIYGAIPATMATLYNLINFRKEYSEIPQYDKDSNFVLVNGRNEDGTVDYTTIPKGNIIPTITNPIQAFLEYLAGVDERGLGELATQLISSTLPVVGEGSTLKEVATKTIGGNIPQLIKPITENLVNKSFWKYDTNKDETKEIVPYYLKDKEPYKQAYEFTPDMYKGIGAVLNVSPLQVKNLMEGYLAGYSKIPAQIVQMLSSVSKGEKIDVNDKTILRRFIKQTYPSGSKTTKIKEPKTGLFARISKDTQAVQELPTSTKDLGVLYKDALSTVDSYATKKTKSQYGLTNTDLEDLQDEFDTANTLLKRIEKERPEQVFDIQLDNYKSGGGATVEERVAWAEEKLTNVKDEKELKTVIDKMLKANVLTKSVVDELRSLGFDITQYTSGGKIKIVGSGSGKKKTSVTIKKVNVPTIKLSKLTGASQLKPLKMTKAPPIKLTPSKAIRIAQPTYKPTARTRMASLPKFKVAKGGFLT